MQSRQQRRLDSVKKIQGCCVSASLVSVLYHTNQIAVLDGLDHPEVQSCSAHWLPCACVFGPAK
jgi:hypothetical protein